MFESKLTNALESTSMTLFIINGAVYNQQRISFIVIYRL